MKRSTEAQAKAKAAATSAPLCDVPSIPESEQASFVTPESSVVAPESSGDNKDEEMPDVDDPDAGFCPTDDQPFRRVRRHTIT